MPLDILLSGFYKPRDRMREAVPPLTCALLGQRSTHPSARVDLESIHSFELIHVLLVVGLPTRPQTKINT